MRLNRLHHPVFLLSMLLLITSCGKNKDNKKETVIPQQAGIEWDQQSLRKVSSSTAGERYSGYARMIQLHDGSLLTIYEADGNIVCRRSNDLGNTWTSTTAIAEKADGINMSVPHVIELDDHSLLASYNGRPAKMVPGKKFNIKTKRSIDGGLTWKDERLLYEAGDRFENGCWEPATIQLPTGDIQLYFANEGPYTTTDEQNISMLESSDKGLSWTTTPTIVGFRKGSRDGMPVPLILQNKRDVVVAIEDNGFENFKPYILRNSISEGWRQMVDATSANRNYALKEQLAGNIYAGAPYIAQLTTGETLLSYQGTEGRTNKMDFAQMIVAIGDQDAKNFSNKTAPFKIPADKSGLWNSITVLDDNTIVAVTSTNAYSENTEVWMIKGKLKKDAGIFLADPTVFLDKDTYYLYGTSGNKGFLVYESADLRNWGKPVGKKNGYALSKGDAFGNAGFWAPQVFKHNNQYFMAYTADEHIAIAKSDHPLGPFKQQELKALAGSGKQIDPYIFFDTDGKPYIYYVKLQNGNRIFVSEMKPDLSDLVIGTDRECISAVAPWENTENVQWPVTEGPTVIKRNELYYLIYSANDFRNINYAVGYATSASPLGPWKKHSSSPMISKDKIKLNGTGHGDFFIDKSGHPKYVMHTHFSSLAVAPRRTGIIDLQFSGNPGAEILSADDKSFKILQQSNDNL